MPVAPPLAVDAVPPVVVPVPPLSPWHWPPSPVVVPVPAAVVPPVVVPVPLSAEAPETLD